jgi:hypothetical protein
MSTHEGYGPKELDLEVPSAARVYDYLLGGSHNFKIDRDFANQVREHVPWTPNVTRLNRSFLGRAVRFCLDQGITQFLDLGSGIPTVGNVHEVAQQRVPDARVVYVDYEPVAFQHASSMLADNPTATIIQADIRDPEYDVDGGWYVIDEVVSDTELTLERPFEGSTAAGEDYTGRQLFTAFIEDFWDTAIFFNDPNGDDVWFATNGRDDIVKFRIADDEVTPMPELGFTCKTLATYKSMMIYANITDDTGDIFPNTIINSNPGEPENVATGLASQFIVHDGVDPINALTPLGDNLVIYAERTSVLTQFIGEPFIFAFRVAVAGIGPIAGRLVADFGDFHEFIGQDSQ